MNEQNYLTMLIEGSTTTKRVYGGKKHKSGTVIFYEQDKIQPVNMGVKESLTDIYLNHVQEGKIWDKVKKVWRDHKGKIITGAALAAAAGAGAAAYDNYSKKKSINDKKAKDIADDKKAREYEDHKPNEPREVIKADKKPIKGKHQVYAAQQNREYAAKKKEEELDRVSKEYVPPNKDEQRKTLTGRKAVKGWKLDKKQREEDKKAKTYEPPKSGELRKTIKRSDQPYRWKKTKEGYWDTK